MRPRDVVLYAAIFSDDDNVILQQTKTNLNAATTLQGQIQSRGESNARLLVGFRHPCSARLVPIAEPHIGCTVRLLCAQHITQEHREERRRPVELRACDHRQSGPLNAVVSRERPLSRELCPTLRLWLPSRDSHSVGLHSAVTAGSRSGKGSSRNRRRYASVVRV